MRCWPGSFHDRLLDLNWAVRQRVLFYRNPMSRKAESLTLSEDDHCRLRKLIESKFVPARVQLRARLLLGAAEGLSNHELAVRFSVSRPTVMKWRRHYVSHGLEDLLIPRTPSRRRAAALGKELEIINVAMGSRPGDAFRWTIHGLASTLHVSRDTVQRTLKNYGIDGKMLAGASHPEPIIISLDPFFGLRITAVVGLYFHMFDRALAFAVDPRLGPSEDHCESSPDLFEPRDIDALMADMKSLDAVIVGGEQQPDDFIKYLDLLDNKVPEELDVHLVMLFYASGIHRDASIQDWLSRHPRFLSHFTPRTDGSS